MAHQLVRMGSDDQSLLINGNDLLMLIGHCCYLLVILASWKLQSCRCGAHEDVHFKPAMFDDFRAILITQPSSGLVPGSLFDMMNLIVRISNLATRVLTSRRHQSGVCRRFDIGYLTHVSMLPIIGVSEQNWQSYQYGGLIIAAIHPYQGHDLQKVCYCYYYW